MLPVGRLDVFGRVYFSGLCFRCSSIHWISGFTKAAIAGSRSFSPNFWANCSARKALKVRLAISKSTLSCGLKMEHDETSEDFNLEKKAQEQEHTKTIKKISLLKKPISSPTSRTSRLLFNSCAAFRHNSSTSAEYLHPTVEKPIFKPRPSDGFGKSMKICVPQAIC